MANKVLVTNNRGGIVESNTDVSKLNYLNSVNSAVQETDNLVTSLSSASTDTQYPSAKCVYDNVVAGVNNAYDAVENKGGTVPSTKSLANLPTAIDSINTHGNIDSISVTPSISQQTITASGNIDGYSPITVNAVTSAIDSNITASNIKSGTSILGVNGTVVELNGSTKTVSPSTSQQTITPTSPSNGLTSVTVNPVTSSIDSNIKPENIKEDVTILGVTGTFAGGSGSKYGVAIDNIFGDVNSSGALQAPTPPADITFTGVKTISANYALSYEFYQKSLSGTAVSFPDLTSISGQYGLGYAFNSNSASIPGPASISFPKLTSISGQYALAYAFGYGRMTSISFPELTQITGNYAFYYAFTRCSYISSISFPKLTSVAQNALAYAFIII